MKTPLLPIFILSTLFGYTQTYDLYVSDAGNFNNPPWQILKFDSAGQNPVVFISTNLNWPQDILFLEDSGVVLISNLSSGKITRYNAATGVYISDFASGLGGPTRMKIGPDSLLYVLQWVGDGLVKKYNLDGTFAGNFTSVAVSQAIGLDWDFNDNLYVSSYGGKYIRRFSPTGADMGMFIDSNLLGPTNIWFNNNNELLVNDYNGTSVKKFDSTGNFLGDFITGISHAEGVCLFPNNNIAIGSGATHSVKLYDNQGNYIRDLVSSGSANLITPNAVVRREINSVSVDEKQLSASKMIYPSSGSEFNFGPVIQKAKTIRLYSIDGKFIQNISIQKTWKPDHINKGYYFVKVEFNDRPSLSEKIFITP